MTASNGNSEGFTLVEMLVVVAIVGLLAAAALPELARRADDAEAPRMASDLKSLGDAIHMFQVDTRNALPGDLEDLAYRVSPAADRDVEGAPFLARHAQAWDGAYLKGIREESGAASAATPGLRTGYDAVIQSPLLTWRVDDANAANLASPPTACGPGVSVVARVAGLAEEAFMEVNDLVDGELEVAPAESGRLRFVLPPGAPEGDVYYLAVNCR